MNQTDFQLIELWFVIAIETIDENWLFHSIEVCIVINRMSKKKKMELIL